MKNYCGIGQAVPVKLHIICGRAAYGDNGICFAAVCGFGDTNKILQVVLAYIRL